jgi:transmembrane sensor
MSRARQANDEAADFIERREMPGWTDADQLRLNAWLAESYGNRAAYWRLEQSWREADRVSALGPAPASGRWARRWPQITALAASLAIAIGAGSWFAMRDAPQGPVRMAAAAPLPTTTFSTPVGARRTVPLADGSKVELNTASIVRASITRSARDVWLDRGEAYFEVAHLAGRPFVVHAGSRTITVLGTKFSVRRDGDQVTVSVVEGRVRVADVKPGTQSAAVIAAGDMVVARGAATLLNQKAEAQVHDALSWRSGMLTFDQSPLPSVAAEFNRYNRKPIMVRGAEASRRRVGGAFPSSDPEGFARLLGSAFGLKVEETADAIIISD